MRISTPEQVHEHWTRAFAAGDVSALLELYEPGALLVLGPDDVHTGREAIHAALLRFLALRPRFTMKLVRAARAGDLAIVQSRWELTGAAPDGSEVRMQGVTADVMRRQADGGWLTVIDQPFGGSGA